VEPRPAIEQTPAPSYNCGNCNGRQPGLARRQGGREDEHARAGGDSRPRRRATRWIEGVESVQIKISVRHGQINDQTQQFIRDKAEKLLHIFERLTMIEVTVDLKKELKVVEFVVQAEHKHDFVARESNADVLAAVDLVLDKLQGQLRRYKEKIQDHRRTPSTGEVAGAPSLEDTTGE
jgi:putative sigma-54 modulation protein